MNNGLILYRSNMLDSHFAMSEQIREKQEKKKGEMNERSEIK